MKPRRLPEYHGYDFQDLGVIIGFHLEEPAEPGVAVPDSRKKKPADILFVKGVFLETFDHGEIKRKPRIESVFPEYPGTEAVDSAYGSGKELSAPPLRDIPPGAVIADVP